MVYADIGAPHEPRQYVCCEVDIPGAETMSFDEVSICVRAFLPHLRLPRLRSWHWHPRGLWPMQAVAA